VLAASITNIGFAAGQFMAGTRGPLNADPRRYISNDLVKTFEWLSDNSNTDAVVLCSYLTGNVLPAFTGRRVYLGHYGQTMDSVRKEEMSTRFFLGQMSEEEARQFMRANGVALILVGPIERELSGRISIPSFARSVYRAGEVELYAVERDAGEN
jgi:hypothetical protein